jgi:hypothetical protein
MAVFPPPMTATTLPESYGDFRLGLREPKSRAEAFHQRALSAKRSERAASSDLDGGDRRRGALRDAITASPGE